MTASNCRFCDEMLQINFMDLGVSPLSNSFLKEHQKRRANAEKKIDKFVYSSEI